MIHHHAELHNPVKYTHEGSAWCEGRIYRDIHTHGNHPFRDGAPVTTSNVVDTVRFDGDWFIITQNTTYKVVGEIREIPL